MLPAVLTYYLISLSKNFFHIFCPFFIDKEPANFEGTEVPGKGRLYFLRHFL